MHRAVSPIKLVAAFAAVYFLWGSTYLFNKIALASFPPFVLAAARFSVAGVLLFLWARATSDERLTRQHWGNAFLIGFMYFVCGNGAVLWAQTRLPSGIAALIVAIVPVYIVLLDWLRPPHNRPGRWVIAGVVLGLAGLVLLIGPEALRGHDGEIDVPATLVLSAGSLIWAIGALYAQRATLPKSATLMSSMQLLGGGALLIVVAAASGQLARTDWSGVSLASALSLAYLIFLGSIVAFSSFAWLMRVAPPARVATYAYVNPVVAILLGWIFLDEVFGLRTIIASAITLAGVALITSGTGKGRAAAERDVRPR